MPQIERRTFGNVEMRAAGEARKIEGYAAVFNSPADIGGMFRELVAPGAFAKAIARDDVRGLINHDDNLVLGRNKAGTLRLAEDSTGLQFEIDPPDTQYARDLLVSLERGDVSQMSFAFQPEEELWDFTEEPVTRTLDDLERETAATADAIDARRGRSPTPTCTAVWGRSSTGGSSSRTCSGTRGCTSETCSSRSAGRRRRRNPRPASPAAHPRWPTSSTPPPTWSNRSRGSRAS